MTTGIDLLTKTTASMKEALMTNPPLPTSRTSDSGESNDEKAKIPDEMISDPDAGWAPEILPEAEPNLDDPLEN